jgi:hypothetical protein
MIPITEMKLREVKFFFAKLRNASQGMQYNEPEEFAFYLNAFLSAARSVTFALQFEDKTSYDAWFKPWCDSRTAKDRELLNFMKKQRNFSQKRGSAEIAADDWEWIPVTEIRSDADRTHPAYGFQWLGPPIALMDAAGLDPREHPPQAGRPVYKFAEFSGDQNEVTSVCNQYVDVLDALVKDFLSWRQGRTSGTAIE